jgi:hypothetical protein
LTASTAFQMSVTVDPPVLRTTSQLVTAALPALVSETEAQYPAPQSLVIESVAVTPSSVSPSPLVAGDSVGAEGAAMHAPMEPKNTALTAARR